MSSVAAGTCVGPYQIRNLIGAGGMGEVYRARDTRLNRDVAVKVLAGSFAGERDRLHRFMLEARAAGALNHPNILAIYDVGAHDGAPYIVSELLEGESLGARLKSGKPSAAKAVEIARQVASGLAAAHARGIVHRDIKPENLFLTRDGYVKILDFGLAKANPPPSAATSTEAETEPVATRPGQVIGTAPYMSPEQVRGDAVDHRSDIFSFGCVLYEMLSSRRCFHRASAIETMNAILKEEPDFTFPASTPGAGLELIVRHCLEKDPAERFQSAGDLGFALDALSQISTGPAAKLTPARRWKRTIFIASAAMAALAIAAGVIFLRRPEPVLKSSMRLTITLPADAPLAPAGVVSPAHDRPVLALSADGSRLAYVAQAGEETHLCVRDMTTGKTSVLPGTPGGHTPFFSPDGASIGFFADGKLKKTSVKGGAPVALADAPNPWGAVWGEDDAIYFNRNEGEGIFSIAADGGPVRLVTALPQFMPALLGNGPGLLVTASGLGTAYVDRDRPPKVLLPGAGAQYAASGHIVYAMPGRLAAAPFNRAAAEVNGSSVVLADDLRTANYGVAQFTIGQEGTLVYAPGLPQELTSFVWVDRNGTRRPLGLPDGLYSAYDLSPDGRRLAAVDERGEIWVHELSRGANWRLTPRVAAGSPATCRWPRWTPDGRHIVYLRRQGPESQLLWAAVDGSTEPVELWSRTPGGPDWILPVSFSPDGSVLVVCGPFSTRSFDIWLIRLDGTDRPAARGLELFLGRPFADGFGHVSPDGRRIVYASDQSGRHEAYVTSFPKAGPVRQVSTNGGREPMWNPKGSEVVYIDGRRMYAVEVGPGPEFRAGEPRLLFEGPYPDVAGFGYDMAPDGEHFLMLENKDFLKASTTLNVITNLFDELRRRVPPARGKR